MLSVLTQVLSCGSVCTTEGLGVHKGEAFIAHHKALHVKLVADISDAACRRCPQCGYCDPCWQDTDNCH